MSNGRPRAHTGSCRIQGLRRETDFPHTTSTYPKSKETREAALVDNAVNLFNLDAA